MKYLLLFFIILTLFGCESIDPKMAGTQSTKNADIKTAYQACFVVDKKLSNHETVVKTPKFMGNQYGFFVENHFKRNRTVTLETGRMIEKDMYALSNKMFNNRCVISSLNGFSGQGNLVIKVDLVSSKINVPTNHNDNIVSELTVLYSFYDSQGNELFKAEVSEREEQKASSSAAYRKAINKTVDKLTATSEKLISQSLRNIN